MTTIITPVNFKRYSKKLHKSFKKHNIKIPLSSAQEILAKTLGFKDLFNLNNQFIEKDSIIVEDIDKYYNQFLNKLSKSNININKEISKEIFNESLGLNIEHNLTVMQIILELKKLVHNENNIKKCALFIEEKSDFMGFSIHSEQYKPVLILGSNNIFPNNEYTPNQNVLKYPNLNKLFPYYLSKLLDNQDSFEFHLNNKNSNTYIELLEQLFSYSKEDIIYILKTNNDKFIFVNKKIHCLKYEKITPPIKEPYIWKPVNAKPEKILPLHVEKVYLKRFYLIIEDFYLNDVRNFKKEQEQLLFSTDKMNEILTPNKKLNSIDFGLPYRVPSLQSRVSYDLQQCFDIYKELDINLNYRIAEFYETEKNEYIISNIYGYDINKNLISIGH